MLGSKYKHHRRPGIYVVDCLAKNCTNNTSEHVMVVYHLVEDGKDPQYYTREILEFHRKFKEIAE